MNDSWHIWVVKQNRFETVERFLNELSEIKEILYPTATKEYKLKSGQVRKKRVPLYSGYLFLRYKFTQKTHAALSKNAFLTTYVGRCSGADLEKVRAVKQLEEWNTVNKMFEVDDIVNINCGPFKGFAGPVVEVSSASIIVIVKVFGRDVKVTVTKDDVDIVNKGTSG